MKLKYLIVGAMLASFPAAAKAALPNTSLAVIPQPREVAERTDADGFILSSNTPVKAVPGLENEAGFLREYLSELPAHNTSGQITLRADLADTNHEAYTIEVTPGEITINGASPAGLFYGIQTLRKAALGAPAGETAVIPAGTVSDAPRFAYRGAMFDICRHYFTPDEVKRFIDMMALHNLNNFHWHISEDQGWRIEIKKYPLLTEIGSRRDSTIIGHTDKYDNVPVEGYFTQEQAREIVDYAAKRHINVIPEIDLPGHMLAALTAYPHLGCTGGPYHIWGRWGVSEDILCAGNDSTLVFLDDVLNEIMDIFPSEYIHIGGDEAPKTRWEQCPKCQKRIAEQGITATDHFTAEQRLQGYITTHVAKTIGDRGRKMIGWDEILEGDIPQSTVVMSWRGIDGATQGVRKGHPVILSPNTYFYFDYYQSQDTDREPEALGGYNPVDRAYS
ncbi:MAG: beta-N-acetylhexosaminidase, partial [Muribaculaceae bacterium]|nr:beta-N-acetylhexosaminidase [Muribaculaceae bacterium]